MSNIRTQTSFIRMSKKTKDSIKNYQLAYYDGKWKSAYNEPLNYLFPSLSLQTIKLWLGQMLQPII